MNGNELSALTYKELQALALRYRVPGNIKKQVLIRVLEAAQRRDEREVGRLLTELKQTRKKRTPRKVKASKLNLTSTPIQSPTYNMGDNYYCSQNLLPYQWVGAEEEITSRDEDSNRIPAYEEFRQFLLRRIQRLDAYDSNNNGNVESSSTVDLRTVGEPIMANSRPVDVSNNRQAQSCSGPIVHNSIEYQIVDASNNNGDVPILLRRMLQAPVGANLGAIASPESRGYRLWPLEYPSLQNDPLNNSDTLTADSDTHDNDDWPIGTEYYRFMNTVKDQMFINQSYLPDNRNIQQIGQLSDCNALPDDNPNNYQYVYPVQVSEVEQNCRQWLSGSAFDLRESNYPEPVNENSRTCQAIYYEGNGSNCAIPRPTTNDQSQNQNQRIYRVNQNVIEGSVTSRTELQYQDQSQSNSVRQDPIDQAYYSQQQMIRQEDANTVYFKPIHPVSSYQILGQQEAYTPPAVQQVSPSQHQMPSNIYRYSQEPATPLTQSDPNDLSMPFRPPFYQQFNIPSETQPSVFPLGGEQDELQNRNSNMDITQDPSVQNDFVNQIASNTLLQSQPNTVLDPFCPTGVNKNSDHYLENILNLQACGFVDYSKIDQTSCIYCYIAPIVSQRLFAPNSSCSQTRRFISEFRQHTFSPNCLLYSDTATGMQMPLTRDVDKEIEQYIEGQKTATDADSNGEGKESSDTEDSIERELTGTPNNWLLSESGKQYSDADLVVDEDTNNGQSFLADTESQSHRHSNKDDDIMNKQDISYQIL